MEVKMMKIIATPKTIRAEQALIEQYTEYKNNLEKSVEGNAIIEKIDVSLYCKQIVLDLKIGSAYDNKLFEKAVYLILKKGLQNECHKIGLRKSEVQITVKR